MRRPGSLWARAATATGTTLTGALFAGAMFTGLVAGCSGSGTPAKTGAAATSTTTASPTISSGAAAGTPGGSVGVSTTVGATGSTASRSTTITGATGGRPAAVTASSAGLTVSMTVSATRAPHRAVIDFTVAAGDNQGFGFFGYQLRYGDGTTDQNVVPHNCPAAASASAAAAQQSWHFSHQYQAPGTYTASVHMLVTCIGDQVTSPPVTMTIF